MSDDLPSGWRTASYAEAALVNRESLPGSTEKARLIEYFDIASIPSPGVLGAPSVVPFGAAPSRARRVLQSGDTLVSCVRPYLRSFAFLRESRPNQVASTGFAVLSPRKGVDPAFLYQTVWRDDFLAFLTERMTGSNYPAVNAADIAAAPLLLPPLPEQKKIAAILASVDEAMQATQLVIDQTRQVKDGLLQDLLTRGLPGHTRFKQTEIGEIPESWEVASIGDLAAFSGGHGFRPSDWSDSGLPIIRIQNLNGNLAFNYYSGEVQEKWLVQPGELLFAWAGSAGASFGPCLWPGPVGLLNQHIYRVTPKAGVAARWLYEVLLQITSRIERRAHGFKSTLLHVHKSDITDQKVALPPRPEQEAIAARVEDISSAVAEAEASFAALTRLKAGLLQDLLTGRVRVSP